jgi:hypothetical protein
MGAVDWKSPLGPGTKAPDLFAPIMLVAKTTAATGVMWCAAPRPM